MSSSSQRSSRSGTSSPSSTTTSSSSSPGSNGNNISTTSSLTQPHGVGMTTGVGLVTETGRILTGKYLEKASSKVSLKVTTTDFFFFLLEFEIYSRVVVVRVIGPIYVVTLNIHIYKYI